MMIPLIPTKAYMNRLRSTPLIFVVHFITMTTPGSAPSADEVMYGRPSGETAFEFTRVRRLITLRARK